MDKFKSGVYTLPVTVRYKNVDSSAVGTMNFSKYRSKNSEDDKRVQYFLEPASNLKRNTNGSIGKYYKFDIQSYGASIKDKVFDEAVSKGSMNSLSKLIENIVSNMSSSSFHIIIVSACANGQCPNINYSSSLSGVSVRNAFLPKLAKFLINHVNNTCHVTDYIVKLSNNSIVNNIYSQSPCKKHLDEDTFNASENEPYDEPTMVIGGKAVKQKNKTPTFECKTNGKVYMQLGGKQYQVHQEKGVAFIIKDKQRYSLKTGRKLPCGCA